MCSGSKTIVIAAGIAVITMFMNWVDIGIIARNGLDQEAYLFLLPWLYPVIRIMKNQKMHKLAASLMLLISGGAAVMYIFSKNIELGGSVTNVSAAGSHLFVLACLVALSGVSRYTFTEDGKTPEPQKHSSLRMTK